MSTRTLSLCRLRRGWTLIELTLTLALLGSVLGVAWRPTRGLLDRWATEGAAEVVVRSLFDARDHAVRRARRVAVRLDSVQHRITAFVPGDTLTRHELLQTFGVRLTTTRDSLAWAPTGLGYGASNARIILSRGAAAETVTVSRLGRPRR
jgi:prepilin-type N-terminal cleavage/methylation domain-containing protein